MTFAKDREEDNQEEEVVGSKNRLQATVNRNCFRIPTSIELTKIFWKILN